MRQIEVYISPDALTALEEATSAKDVAAAIGYLSTWGFGRYPAVVISRCGDDLELVAGYSDSLDTPCPLLDQVAAVWRGDHFSFHS